METQFWKVQIFELLAGEPFSLLAWANLRLVSLTSLDHRHVLYKG